MSNAPLLGIDNLSKYFNTAAGQLHAVDGVSFTNALFATTSTNVLGCNM